MFTRERIKRRKAGFNNVNTIVSLAIDTEGEKCIDTPRRIILGSTIVGDLSSLYFSMCSRFSTVNKYYFFKEKNVDFRKCSSENLQTIIKTLTYI